MRKYLYETALLVLLTGVLGGWVFHSLYPEQYIAGYVWIPLYFYIIGALLTAFVVKQAGNKKKMLQAYLLERMVKFFVSVVAIIIFCVSTRTNAVPVAVAFIINYIIYLIYDSWFFTRLGKTNQGTENKKGI